MSKRNESANKGESTKTYESHIAGPLGDASNGRLCPHCGTEIKQETRLCNSVYEPSVLVTYKCARCGAWGEQQCGLIAYTCAGCGALNERPLWITYTCARCGWSEKPCGLISYKCAGCGARNEQPCGLPE